MSGDKPTATEIISRMMENMGRTFTPPTPEELAAREAAAEAEQAAYKIRAERNFEALLDMLGLEPSSAWTRTPAQYVEDFAATAIMLALGPESWGFEVEDYVPGVCGSWGAIREPRPGFVDQLTNEAKLSRDDRVRIRYIGDFKNLFSNDDDHMSVLRIRTEEFLDLDVLVFLKWEDPAAAIFYLGKEESFERLHFWLKMNEGVYFDDE
jgi:hypothetical protein